MTTLELILVSGFAGTGAAAIAERGRLAWTAYRRSPAYLKRQEAKLAKAAAKSSRHHVAVMDALSTSLQRHNGHLNHADKLSAKLM